MIDSDTGSPVPNAHIVLQGQQEIRVVSAIDGTFTAELPRDTYRVFAQDDAVMSVGLQPRTRLRAAPTAALACARDGALVPVLDVDGDIAHFEVTVTVGATIKVHVYDPDGKPVRDVVVAAQQEALVVPRVSRRNTPRPVLGTDTAISDFTGELTLRVPAGSYAFAVTHPDYAGIEPSTIDVVNGDTRDVTLVLRRGCIVTGKVISADGSPVHDGALETQHLDAFELSFGPSGRIEPDGTFRWTSLVPGRVLLRAWPWHQPASQPRAVECTEGTRVRDVVLAVPAAQPDLAGTIIDALGERVPLAYLDVASLSDPLRGQQERADAGGGWHVYAMPAGRYQISASAPGRGYVQQTVTSPRRDIALTLSGTGRLAGTTTALVDGSFELTLHYCGAGNNAVELDDEPRLVLVRGGRFSVDNVPACALAYSVRWRTKLLAESVLIEPQRTTNVELDIGAPREHRVHGTVRDATGNAVPNARVTAVIDSAEATTVRADGGGNFTMTTQAGAQLVAGNGVRVGRGVVGHANVPDERVDLVLDNDLGQ